MTINALDGHQHCAVDDVRLFPVRGVPHLGDDQRLGVRDPIGEQPLHRWRRIQICVAGDQQRRRVIVPSIGLVVLEELMDTATTQPRGRGDLSDRQPGLVGGDDRPDPFLLCLG